MKKMLVSLAFVSAIGNTLCAEVYTGTSAVGVVGSYGYMIRVDQYIGESSNPWVYAKVGVSTESMNISNMTSDGTLEDAVGTSNFGMESVVFGIGFNLIEYKKFFLDFGVDYYLQVNGAKFKGEYGTHTDGSYDRITNEPNWNSSALEIGAGYSIGNWSYRLDGVMLLNKPEFEYDYYDNTDTYVRSDKLSVKERKYIGLGVTYWW